MTIGVSLLSEDFDGLHEVEGHLLLQVLRVVGGVELGDELRPTDGIVASSQRNIKLSKQVLGTSGREDIKRRTVICVSDP